MRKIIIAVSVIVIVSHAILLTILNFRSDLIIDKTSEFIRYQIDKNLSQEITKTKSNKFFQAAKSLLGKYVNDIDENLDFFEETLNKEIPVLISELKDAKGKIQMPIFEPSDFTRLFHDKLYFKDWLRYKYVKTLRELRIDLNIFLLTNLIVFLMICIVNINKEQSDTVKLFSTLSIIAVVISSLIYIFNQNWFYSIVLNSYFGYSYSLIILIIFGILANISFNKGKFIKKLLWYIP